MNRELTGKEQKVLKRFEKHTLKKLEVYQVAFEGKNELYNIINPVVYEIAGTNTKLVFGDIRKSMGFEDIQKMIEQEIAKTRGNSENAKKATPQDEPAKEINGDEESDSLEKTEEVVAEEIVEEGDCLNEEDINLLINQEKISREKAIAVLKNNNNDVINALVELSKENK